MWVTVVFLIILVQVVQLIFNWLSRRIDKRLDQPSGSQKIRPPRSPGPLCPYQVTPGVFIVCLLKIRKRLKYIINGILLEERNMKKKLLALLLGLTLCLSLAACGSDAAETVTLTVAASPTPTPRF